MLRITQVSLPPDAGREALEKKVRKICHLQDGEAFRMTIEKQSIDARKKPDIFYVYTVTIALSAEREKKVLRECRKNRNVSAAEERRYRLPAPFTGELRYRPIVVGMGPGGLFCALLLARMGLKPLIIERGSSVEERSRNVESFWSGGALDPECNVQFGEGGAGTFSDGKLNTGVKDSSGRIRFVLETFVNAGAGEEILYSYKPHIGTDVLKNVVRTIREEIISLGGEVHFDTKCTSLSRKPDGVWSVETEDRDGGKKAFEAEKVVLAIGHSARDTFRMLHEKDITMTPKAFAVGLRVQHPQKLIDAAQYGEKCPYDMPPSPYKLTHHADSGRGVYSFCMCPGGYVVNASSEQGLLAVNGMSYHDRSGANANSAIVVTVSPEECRDFLMQKEGRSADGRSLIPDGGIQDDVLQEGALQDGALPDDLLFAGVRFQRQLEKRAYAAGNGKVPVQTFASFVRAGEKGAGQTVIEELNQPEPGWEPAMRGKWTMANVRAILPEELNADIEEGMRAFDRKISGFADGHALLAGVESRTSSPVRIVRDGETLEAQGNPGLYPCGEGAGYAGGITSAAVDGMRVAEAIARSLEL